MATQIYKNSAGKRLPSVTTVISRFKDSGGLIHWAWDLGMQQIDYRAERQKAADSGTMAHSFVEAHLHGREYLPPAADPNWSAEKIKEHNEVVAKARNAFSNYLNWSKMAGVDIRHAEVPLVSETHQFGGCLDAMGICKNLSNGMTLLDWKSSNRLYADYLFQMAAYGLLWNENYPESRVTGGYHLLRFSKDTADFTHQYYPDLSEEGETFLLMRKLYDRVKAAEKRCG